MIHPEGQGDVISQGVAFGDVPQGGKAAASYPLPTANAASTTIGAHNERERGGKTGSSRRAFSPSLGTRGHGVVAEVGGAVAAAASKIDATLHVAATTIGRPFQGTSVGRGQTP